MATDVEVDRVLAAVAAAQRSDTAVPAPPPQGKLRSLMTKLKLKG